MAARRFDRRTALLGLGASAVSAGSAGAQGWCEDDDRLGRGPCVAPGPARLRMRLPDGTRASPRRLVVEAAGGVAEAALPRMAERRDEDRIPVAGAVGPFGLLFAPQPASTYVRPQNRLGDAALVGDALVLRIAGAPVAAAAAERLQILTRPAFGRGLVSFALSLRLERGSAAPAGGRDAGGVYWADGRLLVSPPHRTLFGARLWG